MTREIQSGIAQGPAGCNKTFGSYCKPLKGFSNQVQPDLISVLRNFCPGEGLNIGNWFFLSIFLSLEVTLQSHSVAILYPAHN